MARRKHEEKPSKSGDAKDSKNNVESDRPLDQSPENPSVAKIDPAKDDKKPDREEKSDYDYKRKYEDKKMYRGEERRSSYTREREDKKSFHGVKKRDYANGYEHDGKYKRDSHHFEDYKTRTHSSHQKSSYSGSNSYSGSKYSSGKNKDYEEKVTKRYDSKKKYETGEYKDMKKSYQWERERRLSESKETEKPNSEPRVAKKEPEVVAKGEDKMKESKAKSCSKPNESVPECETKTKDVKNDDKKDDRAERRIKNKVSVRNHLVNCSLYLSKCIDFRY